MGVWKSSVLDWRVDVGFSSPTAAMVHKSVFTARAYNCNPASHVQLLEKAWQGKAGPTRSFQVYLYQTHKGWRVATQVELQSPSRLTFASVSDELSDRELAEEFPRVDEVKDLDGGPHPYEMDAAKRAR